MNKVFILLAFVVLLSSSVFADDLLDLLCGNQVCDENENPWNCRTDCPIDGDTVSSGELLGQYWLVRGLIIGIAFYVIWSLFKEGKK